MKYQLESTKVSSVSVSRRAAAPHFARAEPASVARSIGLVSHHSLREQAGERLGHADLADPLQRAGPEAGVEQVQDRMLDTADILRDRQPLLGLGAVERPVFRLAG